MTQTESIDVFALYQIAIQPAFIATDTGYDWPLEGLIPSSRTTDVAEQRESESAKEYLESFAGEYANDVTASISFEIMHFDDVPSKASSTSIVPDSTSSSAKDTVPDAEIGETTELAVALQTVVDRARSQGLHEIANRLIELG